MLMTTVARLSIVCVCLEAATAADCAGWNTSEFFRQATVQDVRACLADGADVSSRDDETFSRYTPLHRGVLNGHGDVVRILIEAGADLNAKTVWGITPLHLSIDAENFGIFEVLIEAGADPNTRDLDGETPLHRLIHDIYEKPDYHTFRSNGLGGNPYPSRR